MKRQTQSSPRTSKIVHDAEYYVPSANVHKAPSKLCGAPQLHHTQGQAHIDPFHVMVKPTGAACNLNCTYCFYHVKEKLYPDSKFRMSEQVLKTYLRQIIESEPTNQVTIAWQGGEPTLMGIDFYQRAATIAAKYLPPSKSIRWTMQTNGILLNNEWCAFFREHDYLIGLSIDGPRDIHDTYRVDQRGHGTFDKVMRAARLLKDRGVDFNALTCVHAANGDRGLEVYRFLRDEVGARYVQFIPVVERIGPDGRTGYQVGNHVTDRSVRPEQWGRFLIDVFEEWVHRDVGRVFVLMFDWTLARWVGLASPTCIFHETCGRAVVLEHTGDVYSCDHFVEPAYYLGNIRETSLVEIVNSEQQHQFGQDKANRLPKYCRKCKVRFACNGECPKNRFAITPDGEPGLNYLCAGYKAFFTHVDEPMRIMARLVLQGRPADEVMDILYMREAVRYAKAGRNDPSLR